MGNEKERRVKNDEEELGSGATGETVVPFARYTEEVLEEGQSWEAHV